VLFVDNREAEVAKDDGLLEEGMRADGDVDLALFESGERAVAFGAPVAPRQRRDAQPGGFGERRHALEMLACENLRRRHQRRLPTRFDDVRHREQGDDRLSRTDVSLQQAQHTLGRGEIGADFAKRLALRGGEAKG
jgi:hypothetical protein